MRGSTESYIRIRTILDIKKSVAFVIVFNRYQLIMSDTCYKHFDPISQSGHTVINTRKVNFIFLIYCPSMRPTCDNNFVFFCFLRNHLIITNQTRISILIKNHMSINLQNKILIIIELQNKSSGYT